MSFLLLKIIPPLILEVSHQTFRWPIGLVYSQEYNFTGQFNSAAVVINAVLNPETASVFYDDLAITGYIAQYLCLTV